MDEKISLRALEDYSDDYASKVTASFFSSKEKITGPEILKVSEVQQVNLFVLRELLRAWKLESQKLRSPYFDYTAPAVSEALTRFQNLLSNHISISRENFQPLLKKAVNQTLFLILAPYDFYSDTLDALGATIKAEDLKSEVKYIKINRVPLETLLKEVEEKKLTTIAGNEAFATLDHILEEVNFTPEDVDRYVHQFSGIVPLNLDTLYDQKPSVTKVSELPVTTKPIEQPKRVAVRKEELTLVAAQATSVRVTKEPLGTLAENFQKRKKIKDSLTINQKFMFTKILFNGDFELFSAAIDKLDELDSASQAKSYLSNNYGEWNPESEEYQEFMEMIEHRFA